MKLLFYRYGSICEPDIIAGFQELGHTIIEMTDEVTNKSLLPSECVQFITKQLFAEPVDFVFSINFFPYLSDVCQIFNLPYLCWSVDSPVMELFSASIEHPCNRIFLFDRAQYNEILPFNPDHVFHLPLAVNIASKQQVIQSASAKLHNHFSSDISFVGSLYTEKCPYDKLTDPPAYLSGYLDGLIESQILIYGGYFIEDLLTDDMIDQFKQHLPGFYCYPYDSHLTDRMIVAQLYISSKISAVERVRTMELLSRKYSVDLYTASDTSALTHIHNRGLAKTIEEMPLIFHNSCINLNITSKGIRSGIPLRVFDILGCCGFLLTNYQTELAELFVPGEDLIVYENAEDLSEKCSYYLSHESERKEIAHNGFQKVVSQHTYQIRLEQMLRLSFS